MAVAVGLLAVNVAVHPSTGNRVSVLSPEQAVAAHEALSSVAALSTVEAVSAVEVVSPVEVVSWVEAVAPVVELERPTWRHRSW